jgi:enolase
MRAPDGEKDRYLGQGVTTAVRNLNCEIAEHFSPDVLAQVSIPQKL